MKIYRQQTKQEEMINSITHGIGVVLSIVALILLVVQANKYGDILHLVSFSIFGVCMIVLYLSSTLYHGFSESRLKKLFHVFDHVSIFLLIAGTYTPITLIYLPKQWGIPILIIVWIVAILGIISKLFWFNRFKYLSPVLYGLMGWIIIVAVKPLIDNLNTTSLFFLTAGGFFYTLGIAFYVWKNQKYTHNIWHLFVLGGSICHFFMVFYLLPG